MHEPARPEHRRLDEDQAGPLPAELRRDAVLVGRLGDDDEPGLDVDQIGQRAADEIVPVGDDDA